MNYLVLHGSFGSPFGNWFPYLRSELEKRELTVYTPDMPTGVGYQNYDNWSKVMEAYVSAGVVNENTIVFAHSIAPIFICKYLVEHKRTFYVELLLKGKLLEHLTLIDKDANKTLEHHINKLAKAEVIDEKLKEANEMEWVQAMNNIKKRAEEIVLNEVIYW